MPIEYSSALHTDCDDPAHKYGTKMRDNIMRFLSTDDRFDFAGLDVKGFKPPEDVVEQIMSRTHDSFVGDSSPRLLISSRHMRRVWRPLRGALMRSRGRLRFGAEERGPGAS